MDSDAEVAAARLGRVIGGRFRLERVLGIGGMAAVYQARDAAGALVALKLLHPEMAARREVRERFVREGSVSERIGHPGVVQTFPAADGSDDAFLVMEMLQGETLRARVKRHGKLPLEEVLDYADQVLDVLVAAHDKGIVHRDLKPDNLFVTAEGRVKILDFGLARLLDGVPGEHRTRTGVALGTLAYMAPEQALGRRAEIDGRVDVFALGATMFRILSGRRVHEAESEAELLMAMASRPAPPLASVAPGTPEPVCNIVDLSLAFSRDARYPDARTMLADVRALRAGALPPHATARLASRDEATRAEGPAASLRTQPLEAAPVPSQRGGTVPLAAYQPSGAPGAAPVPSLAPGDTSPMSARGNTAPMSAQLGAGAGVHGIAPGAVAATAMASTAPAVVPQAKSTGTRGVLVAVGALSLMLGLGGALWFLRASRGADATARPLPVPEPSAEAPALVGAAPAAPARAEAPPPQTPAVPAAEPALPAPPPAAVAARPAPAPAARAEAPAKAAPAASVPAAEPAAPVLALPAPGPAPSPAAAPSPAPAPPPAAAPAPAPAPPPPTPPAKRGKGKGKKPGDPPE